MTRNGKAEQAAALLTVDHRDDARAVFLLHGANEPHPLHGEPAPHEQRLKHHDENGDPDERGEIERHDGTPTQIKDRRKRTIRIAHFSSMNTSDATRPGKT